MMMTAALVIEPVATTDRAAALAFVAGGRSGDVYAQVQADSLAESVSRRNPNDVTIWWARRGRRCVGAAAILRSIGRVGMLLACQADAPGADADAMPAVIRSAAAESRSGGSAFVQSLTPPHAKRDLDVLKRSGFDLLAELVYMRLMLSQADVRVDESLSLRWRSWGQYDQEELKRAVQATYVGSADCPKLAGLRKMDDVVASHRECGTFRPESWWLVESLGQAAGCILVNDADPVTADVVYMGVAPEFRRRGVGSAMLRKAADAAMHRGKTCIMVTADAANRAAMHMYHRLGYREQYRRLAHILK